MDEAPGPFRIYRWTPGPTDEINSATLISEVPANGEKPEGLCRSTAAVRRALFLVYDHPRDGRVSGGIYTADWAPFP